VGTAGQIPLFSNLASTSSTADLDFHIYRGLPAGFHPESGGKPGLLKIFPARTW